MTTSFLQKFKGKTQQVGKQGMIGLMNDGTNTTPATKIIIQTNIQQKSQNTSTQRQKSVQTKNHNKAEKQKQKTSKQKLPPSNNMVIKQPNDSNKPLVQKSPYFVMNPFSMDEQEQKSRQNPQIDKKSSLAITQKQQSQYSFKDSTRKTTNKGNSTDSKGWTKLGGLGANIGGENWQQKKKKIQKMQEFAEQVKMANQQKVKERKPFEERQPEIKKQKTIRDKALEYSKNIPKPTPKRVIVRKQQVVQQTSNQQNRYSELQEYERRHKELQKMINN